MRVNWTPTQNLLPSSRLNRPKLWVIAGCNGAGKSSYSLELVGPKIIPFDYDKWFLEYYNTLQPSDFQDRMAHNLAFGELEKKISEAIKEKKDFCYESNFNSTPLFWPEKFKKAGYELHLIYFVLNSIEEAKRRVAIRVLNGGHFVPDYEIESRYFKGFENLNLHYMQFDSVDVYDCSYYKQTPKFCFSLINSKLALLDTVPEFLSTLIPNILQVINKQKG